MKVDDSIADVLEEKKTNVTDSNQKNTDNSEANEPPRNSDSHTKDLGNVHSGGESERENDNNDDGRRKAFFTEVEDTPKARRNGVDKGEDDELGIYEDTDDGDDLTDTEMEIERLREEKRKRDEEEKSKETSENDSKALKPVQSTLDNANVENADVTKDQLQLSEMLQTVKAPDTGLDQRINARILSAKRRALEMEKEIEQAYQRGPQDGITSMAFELQQSRNASRLALESREAMFRRAMTLLSARCNSTKQIDIDQELPFGIQVPKYFYVLQEKPVPMEPLKAWRGYNGNIYFQPINVCPLKVDNTDLRAKTSLPRQRAPQRVKTSKSLVLAEKENHQPLVESRSESRQTAKSSNASRRSSNRQMAILDKQTVLNRLNDSIHEDLVWLEGQESTGSLAVRPKTYPDRTKEKERDLQYNKERIKKGSVVHKLYVEKGKGKPKFAVSGGKFTPPNSMSPLLRTQTQYSLSSHRLTTNSPDPYHLNDSKLPPLDQIRASLKHMDTKGSVSLARGKTYTRSVTLTDDMKPFVKYSPDVVAKFNKQANIC